MRSLILGAILLGFSPIFVRLVHVGPTAAGVYRCGFAAVLLFLYLLTQKKALAGFLLWPRGVWGVVISAGLFFCADLYFWHKSVWLAGAGIGTILANTQVLYVAAFGILFLQERPTLRYFLAVIAAVGGVYLLTRIPPSVDPSAFLRGILCGLATGLVYAGYILSLRQLKSYRVQIPFLQLLTAISTVSALSLLGIAVAEGEMPLPQGMDWFWLIVLAVSVQIVAWVLISRNLAKIPASTTGLIITLQPVVATILGVLLLGEHLTTPQLLGSAITLTAIYAGSRK